MWRFRVTIYEAQSGLLKHSWLLVNRWLGYGKPFRFSACASEASSCSVLWKTSSQLRSGHGTGVKLSDVKVYLAQAVAKIRVEIQRTSNPRLKRRLRGIEL
jgi:hypothetical protein